VSAALLTAALTFSSVSPSSAVPLVVTFGLPAGPYVLGAAGDRPGGTEVDFPISDQVTAFVDVATGNLRVQTSSLTLQGVTQSVPISQTYNSQTSTGGGPVNPAGARWTLGVQGIGALAAGDASAVVYTAADGATWSFAPVCGLDYRVHIAGGGEG